MKRKREEKRAEVITLSVMKRGFLFSIEVSAAALITQILL